MAKSEVIGPEGPVKKVATKPRKVPAKKAAAKPRSKPRTKRDCPDCAGSGIGFVCGVRAGECETCKGKGKV